MRPPQHLESLPPRPLVKEKAARLPRDVPWSPRSRNVSAADVTSCTPVTEHRRGRQARAQTRVPTRPHSTSCSAHVRDAFRLTSSLPWHGCGGHVCGRPSCVPGLSVVVMSCAPASRRSGHPESRRADTGRDATRGLPAHLELRATPEAARLQLVHVPRARIRPHRSLHGLARTSSRASGEAGEASRRCREKTAGGRGSFGQDLRPPPEPWLLRGRGSSGFQAAGLHQDPSLK